MTKSCPKCDHDMVQRLRDGKKAGWYCRPCAARRAKRYRQTNPRNIKDSKLWTYYRLRLPDLERMLEEQDGRCLICNVLFEECTNGFAGEGYCIDHDHSCCPSTRSTDIAGSICGNCVRGLICQHCNVGIGMLADDIDRLKAAIRYLESAQ